MTDIVERLRGFLRYEVELPGAVPRDTANALSEAIAEIELLREMVRAQDDQIIEMLHWRDMAEKALGPEWVEAANRSLAREAK